MNLEETNQLDAILSKIPDEAPEVAEASAPETASEQPEQQEPTETEVEQERVEPETPPAIEPPPTWKAELKTRWKDIPPDLQREFAQWETERNQGVNSKLNESAEAKKVAETEKASAAQERQRYAQQLEFLTQQATQLDPVLSYTAKMTSADWDKLWAENPAQAGQLKHQAEQRIATINHWSQERQRLDQENFRTNQAKAETELAKAIPEWSDATKGPELRARIKSTLVKSYGYKPEELSSLTDHRSVLVAHHAMLWQQSQAAKETLAAKKVPPAPAKVVRPGPAQNEKSGNERVNALKQRAIRTGRDDDVLAAIMAATKD